MARNPPRTPIRHSALLLQDSPFSDYFTDEAGSFDNRSPYSAPSPSAQKLLVRLHTLGAEILRQDPSEHTTDDLSTKLDLLEATLNAPVAQTRQSAHLADSGLFLEDDDQDSDNNTEDTEGTPSANSFQSDSDDVHQVNDTPIFLKRVSTTSRSRSPRNQDRLLKKAQHVLERVQKANVSLRQRYDDMRQLNQSHKDELQESAQEALRLKSENESLKADLGFDHSELLFMKLQLKALEVQLDVASGAEDHPDMEKRILFNNDIDRWKADWDDVDARLRSRRQVHEVTSTTPTKLAGARNEGKPKSEDQGLWRLEMCKKTQGRVQSITIKRLDSHDAEDEDDGDQTLVEGDLSISRKASDGEQATLTEVLPSQEADKQKSVAEKSEAQYCEQATQTETTIIELDGEEDTAVGTEFLGMLHRSVDKPQYCEQAVQTDVLEIEQPAEEDAEETCEPPKDLSTQTEKPEFCEQATRNNEEDADKGASGVESVSHNLPVVAEKLQYREQATQTDRTNLLITYDVDDDSYNDEVVESEDESEDEFVVPPKRTAWQELCNSLSAFAGMDEE